MSLYLYHYTREPIPAKTIYDINRMYCEDMFCPCRCGMKKVIPKPPLSGLGSCSVDREGSGWARDWYGLDWYTAMYRCISPWSNTKSLTHEMDTVIVRALDFPHTSERALQLSRQSQVRSRIYSLLQPLLTDERGVAAPHARWPKPRTPFDNLG